MARTPPPYPELIKESASKLRELEKTYRQTPHLLDRVRFLRYLKTKAVLTQQAAGDLVGISKSQSQRWWKSYRESDLDTFLTYNKSGYWGKLSSHELSRLQNRLDNDTVRTQKEIAAYLEDEMQVSYTQPGIHFLCKRLKIKAKTPRPRNYKKDEEAEINFKKTSLNS